MHNHRFPPEAELVLKSLDFTVEYPVFVIKIRYIGHHEVKSNALLAWLVCLSTNVTDHVGQSPQVLFVRKEEDYDGIGKLPGADSTRIRVSSTGVNQHVVWFQNPVPLLLEILEQQISVTPVVQLAPVNLVEIRGVGLVPARRHDPQSSTLIADSGTFADKVGGVRSLSGFQILGDEIDDSGNLFIRPQHVEGVESGRLNVEVHDKYAAAAEGEGDGRID